MKKRYEFCYLGPDMRPMFCIMYDDTLVSACERLLCRSISPTEIDITPNGNYILQGWTPGERVSVKETEVEASSTFSLGNTVVPAETKPIVLLDLGGLDLSRAK